ncbi:MAG TPA: MEDS domain-containing protein [Candidatus Dormibacteraeota bacterium]|nr:MEDS domain-containing protein [Candidatus Dormibacteraeota bacterium]
MGQELVGLGWDGQELPLHSYVAFYYIDSEALRRSLAFLRLGLDEPDTFNVLLADAGQHERILRELQNGYEGDVRGACEAGRLATVGLIEDFEELAGMIRVAMDAVLGAGYRRVRVLGLVGWGLPWYPDAAWLKRCEAEVNEVVARYPMVVVCLYDVPSFVDPLAVRAPSGLEPVIVTRGR